MHNATAITTGSANQRPNTPCIRLLIDVIFRGLEDSYTSCSATEKIAVLVLFHGKELTQLSFPLHCNYANTCIY